MHRALLIFKRRHPFLWAVLTLPWWIAIAASIATFFIFWWLIPDLAEGIPVVQAIANNLLKPVAPYSGLFFLVIAAGDLVRMLIRLNMLDRQTGIESIKALSWQQFEILVAEAFRLAGYRVVESGGGGPDGGVDLVLWQGKKKSTVQCKQWRTSLVGASIVKEMYGVMHAEGATDAYIVTSGGFSDDAITFASEKPIHLIDGDALVRLVKEANIRRVDFQLKTLSEVPLCPDHKKPMRWKLAQRGEHAGWWFWGCREYGRCGCKRVIDERDWDAFLQSKADNPEYWRA